MNQNQEHINIPQQNNEQEILRPPAGVMNMKLYFDQLSGPQKAAY